MRTKLRQGQYGFAFGWNWHEHRALSTNARWGGAPASTSSTPSDSIGGAPVVWHRVGEGTVVLARPAFTRHTTHFAECVVSAGTHL
jgi:hypothetical protein